MFVCKKHWKVLVPLSSVQPHAPFEKPSYLWLIAGWLVWRKRCRGGELWDANHRLYSSSAQDYAQGRSSRAAAIANLGRSDLTACAVDQGFLR